MSFKVFPFRLYKVDQEDRKLLQKQFKKEVGRKVDFSMILRYLMADQADKFRKGETYFKKPSSR